MTGHDGTASARAADDLYRALENMIMRGELPDGAPLPPERTIVKRFGVSRTVAREAVQALANKGLVQARPRYRPVVRTPCYDTALETVEAVARRLLIMPGGVRNLFDIRIMLEATLVRSAAQDAGEDDLCALRRALDDNGAAIGDSDRFYETDMAFHEVLYHIPRNPLLPAIHKAYNHWLEPHWGRMADLPDRNRHNHAAHSAIYEAIAARNPDAAERALRHHLADSWTQVQQTFGGYS